MHDSERTTSRWDVGIRIAFFLLLVSAPVLYAVGRMQRTEEERAFVGTWRMIRADATEAIVVFREDGTGTSDGAEFGHWSVHAGTFIVHRDASPSRFDLLRQRVFGIAPEGDTYPIAELSEHHIVVGGPTSTTRLEFTR